MKPSSSQSSFKQLFASNKFARRSAGYLAAPFIAMIVFSIAMGWILWTLNNQEQNQQNLSLFRELAYAKQRIQVNFSENEEEVLNLVKLISNSERNQSYPQEFVQNASELFRRHPEVLQIKWFSQETARVWNYPIPKNKDDWFLKPTIKEALDKSLNQTLSQSREVGHAQYGDLIELDPNLSSDSIHKKRNIVFWYVLPNSRINEYQGGIAILYSAHFILSDVIPKDLTSRHRFSVVSGEGKTIVSSIDRNLPRNTIRHEIPLDTFGTNLYLRGESFPLPSNLAYRMLLWLVIGLCLFVLWSLWSVWKQMQSRQEIQKSLIAETNFRRAIEDSMPIGIRVHDLEARITYVNPAFCRMIGWKEEELIGLKPPFPFWPDKDHADIMNKMRRAMANGHPKTGTEATLTTKHNKILSLRTYVSALIDEKGKQTGWISSIVDISEPKKFREELAASHQRFTTVLEGLDAAVSVVNPKNGELLFGNKLYRDRFGNTSKGHINLVGGEMQDDDASLLDQDSVDGFAGLPASALTPITGESREVNIPEFNAWFEVRRRYIPWTDGHLAQLVIATDITRRHNAEEQARVQEEKMQFASRLSTMGEMASSLAHELNQPLAAINNYCMGVISRLKTKNDQSISNEIIPALEKAGSQALRAGNIIQRIRGFVKRSAPQRQSCSIQQIVSDAVELSEIEAHRQSLELHVDLAPNLPNAFLDPVLIQQVLVNLIKNSIDSMRDSIPRGGRFNAPPIQIVVDLYKEEPSEMLRIRVIDSGKGIPETVLSQIYEPFFSTKVDGMGMGLNICRSIIESHEGRLWAENRYPEMELSESKLPPALGCTFTILLPIEKFTAGGSKIEANRSMSRSDEIA